MGIKHKRAYEDIISEFEQAIMEIHNFYLFFDMNEQEWQALTKEEQKDIATTLADDLFYGLDSEHKIIIGDGFIEYVPDKYLLLVQIAKDIIRTIVL